MSEKGKVFTIPVEEKTPELKRGFCIFEKKEKDKADRETKTQDEIAYKAQKFKYEVYAKQVHQKKIFSLAEKSIWERACNS
jgi:hypothetical protein